MILVGLLMREHRLIEQVIPIMQKEIENPNKERIMTITDFVKNYADKLHHGKEEDILFRELKKKKISITHKRIMNQLIREHVKARQLNKELRESTENKTATKKMKELIKLYPEHIMTEDKKFFLQVMKYFTQAEEEKMINEGLDYDRAFIDNEYTELLDSLK